MPLLLYFQPRSGRILRMKTLSCIGVLVALGILGSAVSLRADVVLSTLGSGSTSDLSFRSNVDYAFELTAGSTDETVRSVTTAYDASDAQTVTQLSDVAVVLYSSSAGKPATALGTFTYAVSGDGLASYNLASGVTLLAGQTYWLGYTGASAGLANTDFLVTTAPTTTGETGYSFVTTGNNVANGSGDGTYPVTFSYNAPVAQLSTTTVPEPATWALLVGAAALGGVARRRLRTA